MPRVAKVRKMAAANGRTDITIKINQTEGLTLKEALKEVWELREEHPDANINIEVIR